MESPEVTRTTAVVLHFPVGQTTAPPRIPRRIRRLLLLEPKKTPVSAEEIDTKLRLADLRREQFYENIRNKARPKPRNSSCLKSNKTKQLGQRLEARLQAAEQKRISILAKAQLRRARLDELVRAAKIKAEVHYAKEHEKLGSKVKSRVQQAEVNTRLIHKARNQEKSILEERSSQAISRRMDAKSKLQKCIYPAVCQEHAASECSLVAILEAEKRKPEGLQVKYVAKSVSQQLKSERRTRGQPKDRLKKEKSERDQSVGLRGMQRYYVRLSCGGMPTQADLLSYKLGRCWRLFVKLKKTTVELAKAYDSLNLYYHPIKAMTFEQLSVLIESPDTLLTVKGLLQRLESRFTISRDVAASNLSSNSDYIDDLLKTVANQRRTPPSTFTRLRHTGKKCIIRDGSRIPARMFRYPVRIVLSAFMILCHPCAVFSSQGEREIAVKKAAQDFVQEFELLIRIILEDPVQTSEKKLDSLLSKHHRRTIRSQLTEYDKAWCSFLNCFVAWKVKDVKSLEDNLVRTVCQLELSMIQKCKLSQKTDDNVLTDHMKAMQMQVIGDQQLLREKVRHLSGDAGIERMQIALSETRSNFFLAKGEKKLARALPVTTSSDCIKLYQR